MRKIFDFGINDAPYTITRRDESGKLIWTCPFFVKWYEMVRRCYSERIHRKQPTYSDCVVCDEWSSFMNFRLWMETQDWENKELDKDILFCGNKMYSPGTCVFVDKRTNTFMLECNSRRGAYPVGVYLEKYSKNLFKFKAQCMSFSDNKKKNLGRYDTAEEAHEAWLAFKLEQAYLLAEIQDDPRVAEAIINRYENYSPA